MRTCDTPTRQARMDSFSSGVIPGIAFRSILRGSDWCQTAEEPIGHLPVLSQPYCMAISSAEVFPSHIPLCMQGLSDTQPLCVCIARTLSENYDCMKNIQNFQYSVFLSCQAEEEIKCSLLHHYSV